MDKIDVFIIDPPWNKRKGGLRKSRPNQRRVLDYDIMTTENIFNLLDKDIFSIAEPEHCVFMWTIDSFLHDCENRMKERDYKLHCRFIWDKTNGVCPAFTIRYTHEYLLWFYKPKLKKIASNMRGKYKTVLLEKSREHSRKPEISYKMITDLYPDSVKMDVFSRENRIGWLQYGNQMNMFTNQHPMLF